jgi:hypothetical protein
VDNQNPVAIAAVNAIRTGDTASLSAQLSEHPGLANEHIHGRRTPLLVATDWPGYFPGGPATGKPGYRDQTPAEAAAEPGTQRDNLIAWLQDRRPAT